MHKRGLNSKIHMAVDAHDMPVRVVVTADSTANCTQLTELIDSIVTDFLLADRGYDSNELVSKTIAPSCEVDRMRLHRMASASFSQPVR